MNILEATYKIVTPMFIGDANQNATDIRPPSIKGVLRFWWRALNWGKCLTQENGDIGAALRLLHEKEGKLFGIAVQDQQGGQGAFLLQVTSTVRSGETPVATGGLPYLLGQGLHHFRDGYLRKSLRAGQEFTVSLCFRPNTPTDDIAQLAQALQVLGLLGGMGSRSRKGFGSMSIQKLIGAENIQIPRNIKEYKACIEKICTDLPEQLPPYTAFSQQSRIDISKTGENAWDLLENIGREMQFYRSYGCQNPDTKKHKVLGYQAEQNFSDDHDLALKVANGETVATHPERVVFGLPHNYFFSSQKKNVDVNPVHLQGREWTNKDRGRRASPLFIHIHQFPKGQCIAIQSLLPATFLPPSDRIEITSKRGTTVQIPQNIQWHIIHAFLDRFKSRTRIL